MQWPAVVAVLLVMLDILVFAIDVKAGFLVFCFPLCLTFFFLFIASSPNPQLLSKPIIPFFPEIEKVFLRFQPFPDHLSDNKKHQRTKQNSRRSEDTDPHIYHNCDNNGIYAQLFP